jgi:4-aminobutyrate aminotransferase
MSLQEKTATERLTELRERYIPRGVTTPGIVVDRAEGAHIWDVDGRSYIDFAGGLGCHNTGHNMPAAVAAIHEQVDRYLHQCFVVGMYEPYIEVARRMAALSPCRGGDQKTLLVNSGAEALENAVKIARAATGRTGVVVFEHAFHGRTLLAMTMTSKLVYKKGMGPFAPEVYRARGPYPYRGVSSDDAIQALEKLFKSDVDPESVACVVLEPVQGEGGFIVMPQDYPARLREICDRYGILYVDDEVQTGCGRTGPAWAIEHYGVEPDLMTTGKSIGGGLPLAGVTGRAEVMDAVHVGGLGGTFGGNPVSCVAACAVLDAIATDDFKARSVELGEHIRGRLEAMAGRIDRIGEVRGLGSMLAMELVEDRSTKAPAAAMTAATVNEARKRGLVLLSCGLYSNVIRILVPIVISDEDLDQGLEILEESLQAAAAA